MPIRWYGTGDRTDPTYRHFERVVNLCLHATLFAAVNSGLWFVQELRHGWSHLDWLTLSWGAGLVAHAVTVVLMRPAPRAAGSGGDALPPETP
ncbi:2TM domain-containing protein [Synechococcus sp. RSCCF101]|nr:2TM domain-containing protein [Synechococcus sp. RSCCF101]QEY33460.1 2TM domain-containing protein [Synechococcus sp. RSCCF101]